MIKEKADAALQHMENQLEELNKKELKEHPEYANRVEALLVHHGKVAEEIVERANRFGCDAIVLGSSGSGFLKRIFSGGTMKKVFRKTKKPVFIVSMKKGKINTTCYNT
ncbi:MAG: universal stress protein [bacterium]